MTTTNRNNVLDPRQFVIIKPLPIAKPSGNKLQASNCTVYSTCHPTREQVFWGNYRRRQRQLTRQGYRAAAWKPYEEVGQPLYLEPKRLVLETLGQQEEVSQGDDPARAEAELINTQPPDSTAGSKGLLFGRALAGRREDTAALKKHLGQTRRLVSAVRQGRSYFALLQEEEQEQEEELRKERQRKEAWLCAEPRPPRWSSDSDSDERDRWSLLTTSGSPGNGARPRRKKTQLARPFTPIHRSLTSPELSEAPQELVYRQLCCLSWLLETLTLERPARPRPLPSCWDTRDPGRGRTTAKSLNKERAIETRWEQFVSLQKPRRPHPWPLRSSSGAPSLWKSSFLSRTSSSALGSPNLGSLDTVGPGTDDSTLGPGVSTTPRASLDTAEAPGSGDAETEPPLSDYLRKLLEAVHESVRKEFTAPETRSHGDGSLTDSLKGATAPPSGLPPPQPTSQGGAPRPGSLKGCQIPSPRAAETLRPKSCGPQLLQSARSHQFSRKSLMVNRKSSMLLKMSTAFQERAQERAQSYCDFLENNSRKRLDSSLRRFQALHHVTRPQRLPRHVTSSVAERKPLETEATERPWNHDNLWLSSVLEELASRGLQDHGVGLVLGRLRSWAEQRPPRVRTQHFLRVLGGLQPWELCLPDLCVAIEIVREHVVQMPRQDYDAWLASRVPLPPSDHPDQLKDTHTRADLGSRDGS
ncbi:coiled-coil domain-containing protein 60-like [Osmerus eperlanus]|uniref:coiled-coil domain-containing protein 60-like n=1 Tax=Osmerus eperlanus TaxID=29151 RepID=UPI002E0EBE21